MVSMLQASYKGVELLCKNLSTEEGLNSQRFEFPNNRKSEIQQTGYSSPEHTLTIVISDLSYTEYINKRDIIRQVLNSTGVGTLIHPTYGSVKCLPKPYTIKEDIVEKANYCEIDVTFLPQVLDNKLVYETKTTPQAIDEVSEIQESVIANAATAWPALKTPRFSYPILVADLFRYLTVIQFVLGRIQEGFNFKPYSYVIVNTNTKNLDNPSELFGPINTLIQDGYSIIEYEEDQRDYLTNLISELNVLQVEPLLSISVQKKSTYYKNICQASAFILLLRHALEKTYASKNEVEDMLAIIYETYNSTITVLDLGAFCVQKVLEAYIITYTRLYEIMQDLFSDTVVISPNSTNLVRDCYSIYGDLELLEDLIALNTDVDDPLFTYYTRSSYRYYTDGSEAT
jgi:hypothetical protein